MYIFCFRQHKFLYANSVDPDWMSHSALSDQDLHFLPMSLSLDARHEQVKTLQHFYCLTASLLLPTEPRHEKTCLWGLRPGKTQTGLLSYRE